MKNKVWPSFDAAVADVPNGASLAMMCLVGPGGVPQNLILALRNLGVRDLTVYACSNMGAVAGTSIHPGYKEFIAPGVLVQNNQVRKAIVTIVTLKRKSANEPYVSVLEEAMRRGDDIEVEILPLGVYARRLAAGGMGMGGFYSPIGLGTLYGRGRETRVIDGQEYIFEPAVRVRYGFVRAYKADTLGNLIYKGTARCYNPLIAKAADITIAEVDEIVVPGELNPEEIITPGVFVDRIVKIGEGDWQ